jgi:hypothetical protein
MKQFKEKNFAYGDLQGTKPQLAGYVLADSPAAQAAWLYDIFNGGTGNTGNPEAVLSRDKMLDEISLFWLTDSSASSGRLYQEQANLLGKHNNPGRVELPVAVTVFPHDLPGGPELGPSGLSELEVLARSRARWTFRATRSARVVCRRVETWFQGS